MLDNQAAGVGRYSDGNKPVGQINHGSLSDFVKLTSSYVPPELFEGVQCSPNSLGRVDLELVYNGHFFSLDFSLDIIVKMYISRFHTNKVVH